MQDLERMVVVGGAVLAAGFGLYYLLNGGAVGGSDVLAEDAGPIKQPWPMQVDDPNIANAYNRAAYRDNTLRADEIYNNPAKNYTNDFLKSYAPTVKEMHIPVQQL